MAKDTNPIPPEWREYIGSQAEDPVFIAAWQHALDHNNPPKACFIYATNQYQRHEEVANTMRNATPAEKALVALVEEMRERISTLETQAGVENTANKSAGS